MGRYYHKMLSHYILWLPTLVPEEPTKKAEVFKTHKALQGITRRSSLIQHLTKYWIMVQIFILLL
jgi:hypothetical protein